MIPEDSWNTRFSTGVAVFTHFTCTVQAYALCLLEVGNFHCIQVQSAAWSWDDLLAIDRDVFSNVVVQETATPQELRMRTAFTSWSFGSTNACRCHVPSGLEERLEASHESLDNITTEQPRYYATQPWQGVHSGKWVSNRQQIVLGNIARVCLQYAHMWCKQISKISTLQHANNYAPMHNPFLQCQQNVEWCIESTYVHMALKNIREL